MAKKRRDDPFKGLRGRVSKLRKQRKLIEEETRLKKELATEQRKLKVGVRRAKFRKTAAATDFLGGVGRKVGRGLKAHGKEFLQDLGESMEEERRINILYNQYVRRQEEKQRRRNLKKRKQNIFGF